MKVEASEDCISRQAVLNTLDNMDGALDEDRTVDTYKALLKECYEVLPFVTPKQRWIPVSDVLPKDGTWNLFTDGKKVSVERYKSDAMDHFYPNGRWFSLEEVVAWMPLPEPYEAESEE